MDKLKHCIERIEITDRTMSGVVIEPTLINFFFGNNGTGKTTISKAIREKNGLTWEEGANPEDYEVHVYDRDFVAGNFPNYEKLPGIFTAGKATAEDVRAIQQKTDEKRNCDETARAARANAAKKKAELDMLLENFTNTFWSHTTKERTKLKSAMGGYIGSTKAFAAKMLENSEGPVEHDLDALAILCETAFDQNGKHYSRFQKAESYTKLATMTEAFNLLEQAITSSSDTEFSRFVSALKAMS